MSRHRIVLAEDHAIVLEGLTEILSAHFDLQAVATDGEALVKQIQRFKPEVAVTDITMPVLNGMEALRQVKSMGLTTRFVFLTANPDVGVATEALRLGASGYVLKASASAELIAAIHAAVEGQTHITSRIAGGVLQNLAGHSGRHQGPDLTSRERQVLQLLAEGKTLKEAAAVLNVSPRTVEFHRHNISDKTGLRSTAELSRYAARHGLVPNNV
jgi:DNA-binding NarL/FixJ family response regulator